MTFIADLHIHSRYSRATSQELCFEQLHAWGRRKGIALVGTGDCTHPGWLAEIKEKLAPAGDGVYRLKEEYIPAGDFPAGVEDVRFLLTGEISTIYKAAGATRKVHHVVCLPDIAAAARFSERLGCIGNITSDGRPILGLDSRDLLETLLEASPQSVLIPAHIWTPWFSVLGSKSGFDNIDDCYRDLSGHIFALETGLSSDPPMNWRVSSLDRYALVSNSDAHSPQKLGREANIFTGEVGYTAVMDALRRKTPDFWGTLEFFPEEGKYHVDGHRKCDFSCKPEESRQLNGRCPVCGGPLTLGVEYRVVELADRPRGAVPAGAFQFQSLLSLAEILGEMYQTGSTSKKVGLLYHKLLAEVGPELHILREAELAEIRESGGELLARAIEKMRSGKIHAIPGYDGEYGDITVFNEEERAEVMGQIQLFTGLPFMTEKKPRAKRATEKTNPVEAPAPAETPQGMSPEQEQAIHYPPAPLLIVAGPGAGKTRTLVERIAWLTTEQGIAPASILALTFSNRAAREMAERVGDRLAQLPVSGRPTIATFHKLGFTIIEENRDLLGLPAPLKILAEEEAEELFAQAVEKSAADQSAFRNPQSAITSTLDQLEKALSTLYTEASGDPSSLREMAERARQIDPAYTAAKRERGALDFTDLLILPLMLLAEHEEIRQQYQQRWPHVFVDEYQDVNVLQYHLLRLLCPPGSDLCAIGDPDQAIYGFRGADVRYFLRFRQDYPDAGQIALTRNYRSCRTIVQASSQVIAAGSLLDRRELWSDIPGPQQVEVAALPTPQAEAEYVVQTIEGLLGGISHFSVDSGRSGDGVGNNLGFNDIAVLYRTHTLAEELQQALERSGIPYQRAARKDIFQRPDIRKVLAALTLSLNPDDEAAIATLTKLGVKDQSAFRIPQSAITEDTSSVRAILEASYLLGISEDTLSQAPWVALLQRAKAAEDTASFLQSVTLDRDIDIYDPRAARVTLMTAHASKGLEWEVVFMLGCEEGSFPHPASPEDEERRLFYVAMTRARTHLHLTYTENRVLRREREPRRMTPFIGDISSELVWMSNPFADRLKRPRNTQLALTDLFGE
ncbi:MAG: UvrD-helicase domain-containing protein [Armatimonadota bacterium]